MADVADRLCRLVIKLVAPHHIFIFFAVQGLQE